MSRPRYSLRRKLMASSLIMLALGGLLSLFAGSRLIRGAFLSQAQAKVRHDLASAWMVFDGKIEDIKDVVRMTASLFHGGADTQGVLPAPDEEAVRRHVRGLIDTLGQDGGYIFAPCNAIQADTPPRNVVAMYEEARRTG